MDPETRQYLAEKDAAIERWIRQAQEATAKVKRLRGVLEPFRAYWRAAGNHRQKPPLINDWESASKAWEDTAE